MKTHGKLLYGLMAWAMLLTMATPALAQHRGDRWQTRGFPFRFEMIEKVADKLGLQADTMKKIRDLAYQTEKQAIEIDSRINQAFLDLRRMMDQDKPDVNKVMQQVDKIGVLEIRLKKTRIRMLLTVRDLLSPEQRTKLKQLMRERHRHRRTERTYRRRRRHDK